MVKKPTNEEVEEILQRHEKERSVAVAEAEEEEVVEGDLRMRGAYKEYYKMKSVVLTLEEKNYTELIVFPSSSVVRERMGIDDEQGKMRLAEGQINDWHKMCGHSALIYKYLVGPKIRRKNINILNDRDMNHRAKGGVVSINGMDRFIAAMKTGGFEKYKIDSLGVYDFDLGMRLTNMDIRGYEGEEAADEERLNKALLAKNPKPEVYGKWREVAKILTPKLKSLKDPYRTILASEMLPEVLKIAANYRYFANGRLKAKEAQGRMLNSCELLMSGIDVMMEAMLLNKQEVAKLAMLITDLKQLIIMKIRDKV